MLLKHLEGLLDQVAQNHGFALPVVDLVPKRNSALLKEIHNWQQLAEVGNKSLTN